ncbi:MAG TPA: tRNA (adenosine(37)-N6)-dimethylallyltransferase MiaA [Frankiaceae bacterium]|jgi:tRNA dimethylallyltransferase|nr:tRNA (adenosine(37)-N6)-dimethylallyltransferase MiaA [Frankiaceae bacterium]
MASVIAVVGPTAAGKSDLAVTLAQRLGGEIVNADSMQLYAGMDIGTAKLTMAERQGVPHHLLDIWHPRHGADVANYQRLARAQIDALLAVGRTPVLVGGSGLYVRAALDVMEFPGTDPAIRAQLEADLAEHGPAALHARLVASDPEAAAAILPGNGRRLVRALEVVELTGSFSAKLPAAEAVYDVVFVGVDRPDLDARVAERTQRMWDGGFVEEVRALEADGLREGRTSARALGYSHILGWFDGRLPDEESAKAETVRSTCRFIRRQRSWFRRDPRIQWLPPAAAQAAQSAQADVAEQLIAATAHR